MKKYKHRSIVIGESVYHIGGSSYFDDDLTPEYVEKWTATNSGIEMEAKKIVDEDSLNTDGQFYSLEVFNVPADYCNLGKFKKFSLYISCLQGSRTFSYQKYTSNFIAMFTMFKSRVYQN